MVKIFHVLAWKLNLRALFSAVAASVLVLLHASFYAGSLQTEISAPYGTAFESNSYFFSDWVSGPLSELLLTAFDAPLSMQTPVLCGVQGGPGYLNPFRAVTYVYENRHGECSMTEQSDTLAFGGHIEFTQDGWNPDAFWKGHDEEGFQRPLGAMTAPNLLFFLIQYALLASVIWSVVKRG